MKRLLTLSILALSTIFLLSNFSLAKNNNGQFIFMFMEEEPILPSTPFAYNDITIPAHFTRPELDPGYGRGFVDTTFMENLDNNVATLGRVLFYDKKLSALENISCASCHDQAKSFADGVALSEGVNTTTRRNSLHLNDLGWSDNNHFFWDMSQNDIREMIRLPLEDENEIGADWDEVVIKLSNSSYYPDLFNKAFDSADVTEERVVEALVQFMESMTTFNSRFDQLVDNQFEGMTDEEGLGLELFGVFCSECHVEGDRFGGPEFGFDIGIAEFELDPFIFNNGLPLDEDDLGVGEWNDNGFDHLYKIPTLRNIELTGPYMHDGSIETLEDVVRFYSEETEENEWNIFFNDGGFGFDDFEQAALVSFLRTLTDETFVSDVKFSDPFDLTSTSGPSEETLKMIVKPNPMGDFSIIEFTAKADTDTQLTIINNIGQEVLNETITGNTYQLNKADFASGIYYLNFKQGDSEVVKKLIVN